MQYCLIFLPAVSECSPPHLIFSLARGLTLAPSYGASVTVMGRLLDRGVFIVPYTCSAIVYTVSVLLTAQCKEYYRESGTLSVLLVAPFHRSRVQVS